jgi:CelD/BcsL family acetyltransferase involved in cellulose biosynthesis
MPQPKLIVIRSIDELRFWSDGWDDLWQRSDVRSPLARAETIAQWIEHYAPAARLHFLVVEAGGKVMAALPLVSRRLGGVVEVGGLPANSWGLCGDLLHDVTATDDVFDALLAGIANLDWPLAWLEPVAYESNRWQLFVAAARRQSLTVAPYFTDVVGQVEIAGSWDNYQAHWTGNHRRHLRKAIKRTSASGTLSLAVQTEFEPQQIGELLRRGCEIEDLSWKGSAYTSILRTPGMFDWFLRQAQQLAGWSQLQLTFLELDGRPIAFEYGYRAKATYFSHKVGYDPAFAQLSPGQLLRRLLLEQFFSNRDILCVDFWGPLSDATAKWTTCCYPVGKLVVAPKRLFSQLAICGYGALRRWRRRNRPIVKLPNRLSPLDSSRHGATGDNKEAMTGLDQVAHRESNSGRYCVGHRS